jgi:hypothetical protein
MVGWLQREALGLIALVMTICTGCMATTPGEEHQRPPQEFRAYGQTWKLVHTTRFDQRYYFFGLTAGAQSQPKELLYLYKEDGSKIDLHERIYALQRDGSYRQVECCTGYGGLAQPLISIDNKLVFHLRETNEKVTNCFVQPPNALHNEQPPDSDRIAAVDFLGEFDPQSKRVLLNWFFPGIKDSSKAKSTTTMQQYYELMYRNRAQFRCEAR